MWKAVTAVATGTLLLLGTVLTGTPAHATTNEKVTICHATGSATNPYVQITISENGLKGHGDHEGDIIPAPADGCPLVLTAGTPNNANNPNNASQNKVTICHATHSQTNPYVRITISENGLNGHDGHDGDIIPATDATCPAGVAVNLTGSTAQVNDKLNVVIVGQKALTSSDEITVVISNEDDTGSTEVVNVTGQVPVYVLLNGIVVPDTQIRVLFIRPSGGSLDLSSSGPVVNVRQNGVDVSDSSQVTFGATPVTVVPVAPAPAAGAAPGTVPAPASTGNAGLAAASAELPWVLPLIGMAFALVFGGRLLSGNVRRG